MGSVHEAEDEVTGERVAVKLIHKSRLASGWAAEAATRFRREGRAAAVASGENVVRVIEDGVDEETGDLFIVMELLRGEDLQQLIERTGPLAPNLALRVLGQALRGLHQAHEAGIVHRDVKPANIFLARQVGGEIVVKILDFGIAKITGMSQDPASGPGLTTTGNFLGSPLFMSPEQVKSSKHVDRRSDVWAVGGVLHCALAGRAPHEAEASSVGKLILAICHTPAPPVHEIAPWVPVPVSQIVQRALAIDPRDRYPSAAAMLDAIRPFAPDLTLREDMWNDQPVLVPVPAPPPDDAALAEQDAPFEAGPNLAHARTEPDLQAPSRFPPPAASPAAIVETTAAEREPPSAPASGPSRDDLAATDSQVHPSSVSLRKTGRGGRAAIALGGVLLAGGLGAATLLPRAGVDPLDHGLSTSSASAAASSGASPAAAGAVLRFQLRVSPADAAAFVDGAQVEPVAGGVELSGPPGSVHEVRLEKGGGAFRTSILVTEKGLLPPEIELVTLPSPPPSAAPIGSARGAVPRASGDGSPKGRPPAKEAPSAAPPPNQPVPAPKPTADELMHDHR